MQIHFPHIHLPTCDSTQEEVKRRLPSLPDFSVVSADSQGSGHGRHGRAWVAPAGKNLLFSLLLPLDGLPPERWAQITQLAAISLARQLRALGVGVSLKWPNDILHGTEKICGILSERKDNKLILGIGLNVNVEAQDLASIGRPASSLKIITGKDWDPQEILQGFLKIFAENWQTFWGAGMGPFVEEWRQMGQFVGHAAQVVDGISVLDGTIAGVNEDGSLRFRLANGEEKNIWSGDLNI
jgi:BirA family biotin operon repressor/biotin-[acetyl-CoA-carboxylase] ligase